MATPIGKHFTDLNDKWMIISSGAFVLSQVYPVESLINSEIRDISEIIFRTITVRDNLIANVRVRGVK